MTITAATWGHVYILCFSAPLGNLDNRRATAQHYVGWARDLEARIADHRAGRGARITRAAVARGITFTVHAWPAPLGVEKWLKAQHETVRFCPSCAAAAGRTRRMIPHVDQLVLPFDDQPAPAVAEELPDSWDFDQVPPPAQAPRTDWYELSWLRRWRAGRATQAVASALTDDEDADGDLPY